MSASESITSFRDVLVCENCGKIEDEHVREEQPDGSIIMQCAEPTRHPLYTSFKANELSKAMRAIMSEDFGK